MKIRAQRHFTLTRKICDRMVFGSAFALLIVLVGLNWSHIASARPASQLLLALAVLFLLTWPSFILSRLLCEVLRECISAQCTSCGGTT
jgi:hypothetical protein